MNLDQFSGVLAILQVPYHEDFSIDFGTLEREIDWNFERRVNGVGLAMASEIFRFTDGERDELVERTIRFADRRGPVFISVGAESAAQAVRHARVAANAGADALMAIPPVMTVISAQQTRAYYDEILNAVSLPLIVQDASGYVGNAFPVEIQADLFARTPERIMFKPEAHPLGPTITALFEATGRRARIFEGSGGVAMVESYLRGAAGTMPGGSLPWAIIPLWNSLAEGDTAKARAIHSPLSNLMSVAHNLDAFISIEKLLLCEQGIFRNTLIRGPVGYHIDGTTRDQIFYHYHQLKATFGA